MLEACSAVKIVKADWRLLERVIQTVQFRATTIEKFLQNLKVCYSMGYSADKELCDEYGDSRRHVTTLRP
jgi:hypothetical protein